MNPILALLNLSGGEILLILFSLLLMISGTFTVIIVVWIRTLGGKKLSPPQTQSPALSTLQVPARRCPECGKDLNSYAPEGLCPACLLRHGLATEGDVPPGASPFTPPTTEELTRLFPQLEILGPIGQGGMGAVYKARQPALDRCIALKILATQSGSDTDFAGRFTREARALARLSHPNIVAVYDFGRVQRSPGPPMTSGAPAQPAELHYFIMEYVDGLNLRELERTGKLSPREALQIIPQICAALQFAHDEGIVHRDIKPENVLLDKKGRVKIADFGLAKILGKEPTDFRLTGARDVVGTPHYMAPEQIEKPQEVDHRADIYSLGVVFYEMLTGELPLGKFQPPSQKVQVDVRLDEVVLRALEKEPERRYQQAGEVKTRVETIATSPPKFQDQRTESQIGPRLSSTAIVGACLVPFFFVSMFFWDFGELGGFPALRGILISSLGFVAIVGATILGWVAIGQIRRSGGRLDGMWLAVADALLLPLLILDILLLLSLLFLNKLVNLYLLAAWYPDLKNSMALNLPHFLVWLLVTTAVVIGSDYAIIRRVWRTANRWPNNPLPPGGTRRKTHIAVAAAILSILATIAWVAVYRHSIKSDYIGQASFPNGDLIKIYSVQRSKDRMVVKGAYNLVSHDSATLGLDITSTNRSIPEDPRQRMKISKGFGTFELIHSHLVPGWPHVSMYADGGAFAALYFGNKAEAIEEGKLPKGYSLATTDVSQLTRQGWQLWQAQKLDEAETKFHQAAQLAPTDANAWNGLGWAQLNAGKSGNAEMAFQKAITIQPDQPGALNGLGQIYLSQRKYDEAEKYLLQAAPKAPAAWFGLARLFLLKGDFEQAEKWAQNIVDSGQADETSRKMLEAAKQRQLSDSLRLMIEPPAKPFNAGAAVAEASKETWVPTLTPGEKPDLHKILEEANDLMKSGRYDEALKRHIWYHHHALEYDPAQVGVRLSFALSDWIELGRRYPKAKQALIEIRDADTKKFINDEGYFDLFMEVNGINRELQQEDRTYELFKEIEQQDKALARQCFEVAKKLLVERGDYKKCLDYIGDPQEAFGRIRDSRERMKAWGDQQASQRERLRMRFQEMGQTNSFFTNAPALPKMPDLADKNFVDSVRQLIEILVGAGRKSDAEKIREQASGVVNDPRLKSAVTDAEAVIQNRKTSTSVSLHNTAPDDVQPQ